MEGHLPIKILQLNLLPGYQLNLNCILLKNSNVLITKKATG